MKTRFSAGISVREKWRSAQEGRVDNYPRYFSPHRLAIGFVLVRLAAWGLKAVCAKVNATRLNSIGEVAYQDKERSDS